MVNLKRSRSSNFASNDPKTDYEIDLFHWLANTKDYRRFERRIADELSKFKIDNWSYIRLDIPIQISASDYLGTVSPEHVRMYEAEALYDCDFLVKHVYESLEPIYKSDIDHWIQTAPVATSITKRYLDLSAMNHRFGVKDSYCMPLASDAGEGRALFAINTKQDGLKNRLSGKETQLLEIGRAINDAGVINFPDIFTDGKKGFERLVNSQPFNLLVTMVRWDLTLNQAADRLDISVNTAQKHILNIRRALGVKTNYGAYEAALRQGLIVM